MGGIWVVLGVHEGEFAGTKLEHINIGHLARAMTWKPIFIGFLRDIFGFLCWLGASPQISGIF